MGPPNRLCGPIFTPLQPALALSGIAVGMSAVPEFFVELFARYGYGVIFVGVLLENAGAPEPGHLGDNAVNLLGPKGGRALVERHRRLLHRSEARQRRVTGSFERHGAKTVFIARFVTGLQTVGALFAGMSKRSWPPSSCGTSSAPLPGAGRAPPRATSSG